MAIARLPDHLGPIPRKLDRLQREQFVERQAEAVEITPRIAPPAEPLGGHVTERANEVAGTAQVVVGDGLRKAEVGHPDHSGSVEQQVRGLDVAMPDALLVARAEAHRPPGPPSPRRTASTAYRAPSVRPAQGGPTAL